MALLAGGLLAGCETTSGADHAPEVVAGPKAETDPLGDFMKGLPSERIANVPPAEGFIGRPVAALEAETGAPALTRVEGSNEFRRYDLGACRLYAVIMPAGGNVSSLAVGPSIMGRVMPSFAECLVARRAPGS
ncbi:hypothetical protein [Parvularcula marina]|uniref:Uncharacterized protein n=1 Tax=Parvularcula marina TaxID=2292771 RepID=A0A371RI91_9PROT|nr:hypothetical protein [Parvularcula marina]RFB05177.1 hypothetical protein DX908_07865 [Parvularcula marina]